jgi:hypothetical protein
MILNWICIGALKEATDPPHGHHPFESGSPSERENKEFGKNV